MNFSIKTKHIQTTTSIAMTLDGRDSLYIVENDVAMTSVPEDSIRFYGYGNFCSRTILAGSLKFIKKL